MGVVRLEKKTVGAVSNAGEPNASMAPDGGQETGLVLNS